MAKQVKQKVVDVSVWNGNIDWQKLKAAGWHAIIRCGYGGDYPYQDDGQWERNVTACEKYGIPYGVYLYSYATTEAQARSEAAHVKRLLKGHKPQYPIYWDSEERGTGPTAAKCWAAFKAAMGTEYELGIYASSSWWRQWLKGVDCKHKWVAEWTSAESASLACEMWQYSSSGSVPGVPSKREDVNWCYVDFSPKHESKYPVYQVQSTIYTHKGYHLSKESRITRLAKGRKLRSIKDVTGKTGRVWGTTIHGNKFVIKGKDGKVYAKKA